MAFACSEVSFATFLLRFCGIFGGISISAQMYQDVSSNVNMYDLIQENICFIVLFDSA